MSQDYHMNYSKASTQRYSDVDVFSTQGRIGRKRYFVYSVVLPVLIFWAINTIAALASYVPFASNAIFYAIIGFGAVSSMYMMIHLTIQRCHDFNKSATLAVFALIPFANIVFALIPGTNGLNSYGEVPVPATIAFKTSFYALIAVLVGLAIYAMLQLSNTQFISNLLVF